MSLKVFIFRMKKIKRFLKRDKSKGDFSTGSTPNLGEKLSRKNILELFVLASGMGSMASLHSTHSAEHFDASKIRLPKLLAAAKTGHVMKIDKVFLITISIYI